MFSDIVSVEVNLFVFLDIVSIVVILFVSVCALRHHVKVAQDTVSVVRDQRAPAHHIRLFGKVTVCVC